MKFTKAMGLYLTVWAVLLAVFNVVCFVIPPRIAGFDRFDGSFWVGYVFITVSFIGQLICAFIALSSTDKGKTFYRIPLVRVSYSGLISTLIFGGICMAIPMLPEWIGIIVCVLVLAFTVVAVAKATVAAAAVEAIDEKIQTQTFFIRNLTVEANSLMNRAQTEKAKSACKKVYEAVRYSDPMSNAGLAEVEGRISAAYSRFTEAVLNGSDEVTGMAEEVVTLVAERNSRCKLLK